MMNNLLITKRDGRLVPFDARKIITSLEKSYLASHDTVPDDFHSYAVKVADKIHGQCKVNNIRGNVEDIQDAVEMNLMGSKYKPVARDYILYRDKRTRARKNTIDDTVKEIVGGTSSYWKEENSNKDFKLATTQRDYIAGAVSTDMSLRELLPDNVVEAHKLGIIHFHDMDYYISSINNCSLVNLEDMLQNGTVISNIKIDKPHKFSTACNIATQIIAQVASSQYGGQSISLAHLSPFIETTRQTLTKRYPSFSVDQIEELVRSDVTAGIQTLQYQIITLMTTNGQAPFITVSLNLAEAEAGLPRRDLAIAIEEVLKQRIEGVKNAEGIYVTPAFPKLIYALDEMNVHRDSQYYYLTVLAAECSAKRMVPDYTSNKIQRELKAGDVYPPMGCRSFLTPDRTEENYARALNYGDVAGHKYYGRFNQGVVTLNLPDVALSSGGDISTFWAILKDRLDLCHDALLCRHNRLKGTLSDIAPILWQNGALARLGKGEKIDELLYHGYSTLSLGYAGLYECTKVMTGVSHTDEKGKKFALAVMEKLNAACNKWKTQEDIDYSVYGTPLESTTYKFSKCLRDRFGVIEGITDHDYITNSYHVNVREPIDAFNKLLLESEFQKLSPGGAITYVEVPSMSHNILAVLDIIGFIYKNLMYAEINSKFDYCHACGYNGEIEIKGEPGKLYWECPNCGNTDQSRMNVARRTCGYIGTNFWNQGRTEEIKDRVLHLDTLEEL